METYRLRVSESLGYTRVFEENYAGAREVYEQVLQSLCEARAPSLQIRSAADNLAYVLGMLHDNTDVDQLIERFTK